MVWMMMVLLAVAVACWLLLLLLLVSLRKMVSLPVPSLHAMVEVHLSSVLRLSPAIDVLCSDGDIPSDMARNWNPPVSVQLRYKVNKQWTHQWMQMARMADG